MATKQSALLARFMEEVWSEGHVEAADRYIAPRYTIHHDPGDPWDGQTLDLVGFKDRIRQSRAPFPDQRFDIREMIAEPDRIAATWHWRATHTGDYPGFPASGKVITMSGITVYYFSADRLTGHWQLADRLGVYRQLTS